MNHLAKIQREYLKEARKWDDLSLDEQHAYLKRHPASRRKLTAKPKSTQFEQNNIEPKSDEQQKPELKVDIENQDTLTKVQQKVFDECEPLIKCLQDRLIEYYDTNLIKFENDKKQADGELEFSKFVDSKYGKSWEKNNSNLRDLVNSIYSKKDPNNYSFRTKTKDVYLNDKRKQAYYERMKEEIRIYNTFKLSNALQKYITPDFVDIKNTHITQGSNGFEISANLIDDKNRQWNFETKAISAGGYNIQIWHYRYIINLSSPEVPKEVVRERVSEKEKQEKELKRQKRKKEHDEKQKLKEAKSIASIFSEIKGEVKQWDDYGKQYFIDSIKSGHRTQEEFNQKEKDITKFKEFLANYNYKRPELTKKIIDGEITISVFKEIKDALSRSTFLDYNFLLRKIFKEGLI